MFDANSIINTQKISPIQQNLTAASLSEVLLTQFSLAERVGCLGPMRDSHLFPPIFNHRIMLLKTDCNKMGMKNTD